MNMNRNRNYSIIDPDRERKEPKKPNTLGFFLFISICLIIFVGIIAISVFFAAVQGEEQTMVPDVRGKDVVSALLELQDKELYPRIQLRYSQSANDRGLIMEQDPPVGTVVKAGRRIRLVVSQGAIVNITENYVGRNINEVRMDLQALFTSSTSAPLLSFKEPFMYEYSLEPAGTILQQQPRPGTSIAGPTVLEFVISRGQENAPIRTPVLAGLSIEDALSEIGRTGVNFSFSLRPTNEGERNGIVVSQDPQAQTSIPQNTRVNLVVAFAESLNNGDVTGLFKYNVPRNPYPISMELLALLPSGERRLLISVAYQGGEFTVPYQLPVGSLLILSMLNREIHRETVISSRNFSL